MERSPIVQYRFITKISDIIINCLQMKFIVNNFAFKLLKVDLKKIVIKSKYTLKYTWFYQFTVQLINFSENLCIYYYLKYTGLYHVTVELVNFWKNIPIYYYFGLLHKLTYLQCYKFVILTIFLRHRIFLRHSRILPHNSSSNIIGINFLEMQD